MNIIKNQNKNKIVMENLQEVYDIIEKNELTQAEKEFVVESYIFEKKQRKVKIDIRNHQVLKMVPNSHLTQQILQQELFLLNEVYNVACKYFFELKNNKQT